MKFQNKKPAFLRVACRHHRRLTLPVFYDYYYIYKATHIHTQANLRKERIILIFASCHKLNDNICV